MFSNVTVIGRAKTKAEGSQSAFFRPLTAGFFAGLGVGCVFKAMALAGIHSGAAVVAVTFACRLAFAGIILAVHFTAALLSFCMVRVSCTGD